MKFKDRVALVVGGASGIGRTTAELLGMEGAIVAVADLDPELARHVAVGIAQAQAFEVDIAEPDSVKAMVDDVESVFGPIDLMVQAAGWDRVSRFVETDPPFWDRVLEINLRGPIAVAHTVLPGMIEKGSGSIVFVSSDAGRVGSSGEVVYSAAKGGVIAFVKALAREVARNRIRVNCVAPGPTDTPFLQIFGPDSEKILDAMVKQTPLRKLAAPDDIARAIAFLLSDDAGHITGQTLSVSGGLTMV
ncbi:MAG: SDR family oxidoreductase [Acidimicrobiia bacterium]|nr:SDR family oxidoreductase [Acidimicrobiia bacterium]MDH4308708.1 SDR family oxidoreductase [Acidimicrobiia bacterium]MDH5293816.1 SDR family oxidoreductase [Acidimicrobiia bacterium]